MVILFTEDEPNPLPDTKYAAKLWLQMVFVYKKP
jgi:hypothetical protein